jgi:high-affinity Fe2+/Pb2+ permease
LLYAVFGYDSQPTWLQIGVYLASLLVALGAVLVAKRVPKHG